jgi:hypothetical protein
MELKLSMKNIIIFVFLVVLLGFFITIINSEIFNPPHPGMSVIKINESGVPDGPIVHMVEDDFNEYPFLAPIIRDKSKQGTLYQNGTRISYYVGLSWQEYDKILGSKFFKNPEKYFFQYQGNYYSFGYKWAQPNLTITRINDSSIPEGKLIQISDDDFDRFPYLAPILRNNSPEGIPNSNGTGIDYIIEIPDSEQYHLWTSKLFPHPDIFIEYKGDYYSFTPPWIP